MKCLRPRFTDSAELTERDSQKWVDVLFKNTSGPIASTVARRMKRSWLLGACAVTFTRKANGTNRSQKLSNGPTPVNPKCEFEAFGGAPTRTTRFEPEALMPHLRVRWPIIALN